MSPRLEAVEAILKSHKMPVYQHSYLRRAIYGNTITEYSECRSLPKIVRDSLVTELGPSILTLSPGQSNASTQCVKMLFDLQDKQSVEAVWMKFRDSGHTSLCISSQVGCALKCAFCSTGAVGFKRQLSSDEIVDQVLYFLKSGKSVDSISFMGMGEALQNPRVFSALRILTKMMNISPRRINVSTVGIIPGIERMTKEFPNVNLAFSLHSPFDDQRSDIVPANRSYPLNHILPVLRAHVEKTRRKLMIAYLVLPGINDSLDHAKKLVEIFHDMPSSIRYLFHLNLLRYNPAAGIDNKFMQTSSVHLNQFIRSLNGRIPFTVRQSFGVDIDAACGQLYHISRKIVNAQNRSQISQRT
jgi:23S rRNA (adenine-C8)-methyltransferase